MAKIKKDAKTKERHAVGMSQQAIDTLDYTEEVTKLYFVRHGQTSANKKRLLFGHLDIDLDKTGIKQANALAKKLSIANKPIDFIISSPLKRARHTAEIISKATKIKKTITDKDLMERGEGNWEGKDFWQVRKEDSKNYLKWVKDPFYTPPPNGESVEDLHKRIKRFYNKILKNYAGKKIMIVTHSGPIRLFILHVLRSDINKFWHLKIDCCSVSEIHISKKHSMVMRVNEK